MEAFYFLRKSQNLDSVFHSHVNSVEINRKYYLGHKFIICFDLENKVNGHLVAFRGIVVKHW